MEELFSDFHPTVIISTLTYSLIGLVMFGAALGIASRVLPFSLRKEIEEDQNTALGVIIGCMFIGIAIIIAAAIH